MPPAPTETDRTSSEETKRHERRRLIADYDIVFKGPVSPSQWPAHYVSLFQEIRSIGRLSYDEYSASDSETLSMIADQKKRVHELNTAAKSLRKHLANEMTWRLQTENFVFPRFQEDFHCQSCQNRTWKSLFPASPFATDDTANIIRRRASKRLCQCTPEMKIQANRDGAMQPLIFASTADRYFEYDPKDLADSRLPSQRPDKVFGLEMTRTLKHSIQQASPILRTSPLAGNDIHYPFLLMEAKSEIRGPGFESIEAQTAFPLRNCLQLQQELHRVSGVPLQPLVWSISCQGDEWRIGAAVIEDDEYQIYDLWLGRVVSQDGALQLLLIMDLICDWARLSFREGILRCLAEGALNLRRWSPLYTFIPPMSGDEEDCDDMHSPVAANIDSLPAPELQIEHRMQDDTAMMDLEVRSDASGPFIWPAAFGDHPFMRWSKPHSVFWARKATVRHTNMIQFSFRELALPEEGQALARFIEWHYPEKSTQEGATRLVNALVQHSVPLTTAAVSRMKCMWMSREYGEMTDVGSKVRALVNFSVHIVWQTWQIRRALQCLTCSGTAMRLLTTMTGEPRVEIERPNSWSGHANGSLRDAVMSAHAMSGKESAAAAVSELSLLLSYSHEAAGGPKYYWEPLQPANTARCSGECGCAVLNPCLQLRSVPQTMCDETFTELIPGHARSCCIQMSDDILRRIGNRRAILLRRPSEFSGNPVWCLLAIWGLDLEDSPSLGRMLADMKRTDYDNIFVLRNETVELATQDVAFLDSWMMELLKES